MKLKTLVAALAVGLGTFSAFAQDEFTLFTDRLRVTLVEQQVDVDG